MTFFDKTKIISVALFLIVTGFNCSNSREYDVAIQSCKIATITGKVLQLPDKKCLVGAKLPIFEAPDMNGAIVSNTSIKGKYSLINLWFLECPPCIEEMPTLSKINDLFGGKSLEVISICRNQKADLNEFLKENSLPYRVVPDGRKILEDIFQNPFGYPTNLLVDKNGKIIKVYRALVEGQKEYDDFMNDVKSNL